MQFRVLGPLEVDAGDGPVMLGGPKQRAVLAHLLIRANQVVPTDTLIEEIWGDEATDKARNTLQTYVSNLRKVIGVESLQGRAPGYVVTIDPVQLDSARFDALIRDAERALPVDPDTALRTLDDALALWRGPALADLADNASLLPEAARLDEMRLQAQERRVEGLEACGEHGRAIAELEVLLARHPLRESLWSVLMLALYRDGRQADALEAYRRAQAILADELGIDPSHQLQRLQERLLRQDPSLDLKGEPLRGYRLLEKVGEGSTGTVFRAIQPHVERDVAIKVIHERIASDPAFVEGFEPSAQAAAVLEHPGIAPVYDYWREPGAAYVVSRFLRGGSLARPEVWDEPPEDLRLRIVEQIATALAFVHAQGSGHGNVCASNVLLDTDGNAYLADFPIGTRAVADPREDVRQLGTIVRDLVPDHPALTAVMDRLDRESDAATAASISEAAGTAIQSRAVVDRTPSEARNPFKGLRPFLEADAPDFFGRTELVRRLAETVFGPGPTGRFLAVVGPSGCGKSSLVRAGVIPELRRSSAATHNRCFVTEMVPGSHPIEELEVALLSITVRPGVRLRDSLEGGPRGLVEAAALLSRGSGSVVLFVDQLEEMFTHGASEAERTAFLELLRVAAADPDSRLHVIVSLRADFYDRPLAHPRFGELLAAGTFAIPPLTPDQLERAIRSPAEKAGVRVDPGLVAEMIAEVANQPGALPLLQYALTELFDQREDGRLTLAAYRRMGGVAGALSTRAEGFVDAAEPEEARAIQQIFLRLVTLGEGRPDTRRRVTHSELAAIDVARRDLDWALDAFGRHRILTFDRDPSTREPTVEIAHEALLGGWARLARWIDEARQDLRQERRIAQAAMEWRAADDDPSFLLRGAQLDHAQTWSESTDLAIDRSALAFLTASVRQRDDELRREKERRERERRTELRSARSLRALVAVFAVATLVAGSLTLVATSQSERAAATARIARARELAAAAIANLETDPERSILLAIEAVGATRSVDGTVLPEAEDALHRAVTASRVVSTLPGIGGPVAWGEGMFATTGQDQPGTIDLRDATTGSIVRSLPAHDGDVLEMRFSLDGALLATSGSDGVLAVWDPTTGASIASVRGRGAATGISIAGSLVAAAWSQERVVRIVDVSDGRVIGTIEDRPASTTSLGQGGERIALSTNDATVVVDVSSGDVEIGPLQRPYGAGGVAWSPDGRYLATSGIAGPDVWDAATGRHLFPLAGHPWTEDLVWNSDSTRLFAAGPEARGVKVWEIGPDGPAEVFTLTSVEISEGVDDLALSTDGTRAIASAADGSAAKAWDVGPGGDAEWGNLPTVGSFGDVAFLPDGRHVVASDAPGRIRVRNVLTGAATGPVIGPVVSEHAFDVSEDGRWITGIGPKATVWSTATGRVRFATELPNELDGANFGPGGEILAINDGEAGHGTRIVERHGRTVRVLPGNDGFPTWMGRFSPDGRLVATIADGARSRSEITIWDWRAGKELRTISTPDAQGIAFDPSGGRIVTMFGAVKVWEARTGLQAIELEGSPRDVGDATFSPDGSRLAVAGRDGVIRLFDATTGAQVLSLEANAPYAVGRLAFSDDGKRLASQGPVNGLIRVWALDINDLLEIGQQNVTRSLSEIECGYYLHLEHCPT